MKSKNMLILGVIIMILGMGIGTLIINLSNRESNKSTVNEDGDSTRKKIAEDGKETREEIHQLDSRVTKILEMANLINNERGTELLIALFGNDYKIKLQDDKLFENLIAQIEKKSLEQILIELRYLENLKIDTVEDDFRNEIMNHFKKFDYVKVITSVNAFIKENENLTRKGYTELYLMRLMCHLLKSDPIKTKSEADLIISFDPSLDIALLAITTIDFFGYPKIALDTGIKKLQLIDKEYDINAYKVNNIGLFISIISSLASNLEYQKLSIQLAKKSIEIINKKKPINHLNLIIAQKNLANQLIDVEKYEEAKQLLDSCEKSLENEEIKYTAAVLSELKLSYGELYFRLGKYELALKKFLTAQDTLLRYDENLSNPRAKIELATL
ncbi:MAG: hypothetical protein WBG90_05175, partial [Saonia sp.]